MSLYIDKNMHHVDVAAHFNCSTRTLSRKMLEFGLTKNFEKRHDREFLYREYITLQRSTVQIGKALGASPNVVRRWLLLHGIPVRPPGGSLKGKKMTAEQRKRISVAKKGKHTGPDHHNWKGGYGKSPAHKARTSYLSKQWALQVKQRDGRKCVHCAAVGVKLHAHHVKSWREFPALRYEVSNGLTLCKACHERVHERKFLPAYL